MAPLYHAARTVGAPKPLAVLNIGGVANVTWLGEGGTGEEPEILAFDTGPGVAMIDDWVRARTGAPFDRGGRLAGQGEIDEVVLAGLLSNDYFARVPPKSLDRNAFLFEPLPGLATADGAATLTAFTARAVVLGSARFPVPAEHWLVTGGGRHNKTLLAIARCRPCPARQAGGGGGLERRCSLRRRLSPTSPCVPSRACP